MGLNPGSEERGGRRGERGVSFPLLSLMMVDCASCPLDERRNRDAVCYNANKHKRTLLSIVG